MEYVIVCGKNLAGYLIQEENIESQLSQGLYRTVKHWGLEKIWENTVLLMLQNRCMCTILNSKEWHQKVNQSQYVFNLIFLVVKTYKHRYHDDECQLGMRASDLCTVQMSIAAQSPEEKRMSEIKIFFSFKTSLGLDWWGFCGWINSFSWSSELSHFGMSAKIRILLICLSGFESVSYGQELYKWHHHTGV